MFDMSGESLRGRLRSGCADVHDRLDREVSRADLRELEGYTTFLIMNATAFDALARSGARGRRVGIATLRALSDAASEDLAALGFAPPRIDRPGPVSPLALDYVVLGSRMGTKMLRRTWASSNNARVLAAQAYFSQPEFLSEWRALCTDLGELPGHDEDADKVVNDARLLFDLFFTAFTTAPRTLADV